KSALALGIALRVAQQGGGLGVAFFSGEMDEERLMERALAVEGRVAVDELRAAKLTDQTRAEVGGAAVRLRGLTRATQDEDLALVLQRLKALALERQVALLVVSQLARFATGRDNARPTLDDFGHLGAIKQHADLALAIYREEMYSPGYGVEGATELLVLKNRNGSTGFVDLYFYRRWMRFEDMLDPDR